VDCNGDNPKSKPYTQQSDFKLTKILPPPPTAFREGIRNVRNLEQQNMPRPPERSIFSSTAKYPDYNRRYVRTQSEQHLVTQPNNNYYPVRSHTCSEPVVKNCGQDVRYGRLMSSYGDSKMESPKKVVSLAEIGIPSMEAPVWKVPIVGYDDIGTPKLGKPYLVSSDLRYPSEYISQQKKYDISSTYVAKPSSQYGNYSATVQNSNNSNSSLRDADFNTTPASISYNSQSPRVEENMGTLEQSEMPVETLYRSQGQTNLTSPRIFRDTSCDSESQKTSPRLSVHNYQDNGSTRTENSNIIEPAVPPLHSYTEPIVNPICVLPPPPPTPKSNGIQYYNPNTPSVDLQSVNFNNQLEELPSLEEMPKFWHEQETSECGRKCSLKLNCQQYYKESMNNVIETENQDSTNTNSAMSEVSRKTSTESIKSTSTCSDMDELYNETYSYSPRSEKATKTHTYKEDKKSLHPNKTNCTNASSYLKSKPSLNKADQNEETNLDNVTSLFAGLSSVVKRVERMEAQQKLTLMLKSMDSCVEKNLKTDKSRARASKKTSGNKKMSSHQSKVGASKAEADSNKVIMFPPTNPLSLMEDTCSWNAKHAHACLESLDWSDNVKGFKILVRLARHEPDELYQELGSLVWLAQQHLKSHKSMLCRTAIGCFTELFTHMGSSLDSDVERVGEKLLSKCMDTNKFIRKECEKALRAMVENCATDKVLHCLEVHGSKHKNKLVRHMTAKLCAVFIRTVGMETTLADFAETLLPMLVSFLLEAAQDVR